MGDSRYRRVGTFVPNSPEWHAQRATGIGGSDVAAVMGLSPYTSPFTLWHIKKGLIDGFVDTPHTEWGTRHEDTIAAKFAECHEEMGVRRGGSYQSVARPYQLANPDRLLRVGRDRAILEIKTASDRMADKWGKPGTDDIPIHYRCQGLWYLDVFGFRFCHFAVLIGGYDYREYVIEYDPGEVARMRDEAELFLASIEADDRPDIDDSYSTYETVRELHPDIDGTEIEIDGEVAARFRELCDHEKDIKTAKRSVVSTILDSMGSARYATTPDGSRFAMRMAAKDQTPYLKALRPAA